MKFYSTMKTRAGYLLFLICLLLLSLSAPAIGGWDYDRSLSSDVQFWKHVFTEYSNDQYIIHDSENLNLIYKVVTFDSTVSERNREKQLEKMEEDLEKELIELSDNYPGESNPDHLLNLFKKAYGDSLNKTIIRRAAKQIRAQQGMRENFRKGLERALAYLPFIREVFREQGLPEELAYLPHIESSYNPLARSKVGAAGMWQFMRSTARLYMKVNRVIDQRYDPVISTRAAARLLKYNYSQTDDWGLAVTAYNFGLAGIKRAINQYGQDYLKVRDSFNHRKFKFASRNFFPEFLAVIEIMEDYLSHFPDVKPLELPAHMKYQLKNKISLPQLAQRLEIDLSEIVELNPVYTKRAIRGWSHLPAGYWINLPIRSDITRLENYFHQKQIELAKENPDQNYLTDSVQDNLVQLDLRNTETTGSDIKGPVNNMKWSKPGVIGENSSHINGWGAIAANSGLPENITSVEDIKKQLLDALTITDDYLIVFPNETLGHFAEWLKIPLSYLRQINHLNRRSQIYQGQKIKLDFRRVSKGDFLVKRYKYHLEVLNGFLQQKEFVNCVEYKVAAGESVWEIANNRYKLPLELIQYFNIDSDINKLFPGDVLRIPVLMSTNLLEESL
jgi:membrane-bound lytic murein transglycosylase D